MRTTTKYDLQKKSRQYIGVFREGSAKYNMHTIPSDFQIINENTMFLRNYQNTLSLQKVPEYPCKSSTCYTRYSCTLLKLRGIVAICSFALVLKSSNIPALDG